MKYSLLYKNALPDPAVLELYALLEESGRHGVVFHDGEITGPELFLALVRRKDAHFWACLADGKPLGMVWLTDCRHGAANMHFTAFGLGHPLSERRLGRFALGRILGLEDEDGNQVLEMVHARIPLRNARAWRWAARQGFRQAGVLEGGVWMADTQKLEAAWLGWASRETIGAAGC